MLFELIIYASVPKLSRNVKRSRKRGSFDFGAIFDKVVSPLRSRVSTFLNQNFLLFHPTKKNPWGGDAKMVSVAENWKSPETNPPETYLNVSVSSNWHQKSKERIKITPEKLFRGISRSWESRKPDLCVFNHNIDFPTSGSHNSVQNRFQNFIKNVFCSSQLAQQSMGVSRKSIFCVAGRPLSLAKIIRSAWYVLLFLRYVCRKNKNRSPAKKSHAKNTWKE